MVLAVISLSAGSSIWNTVVALVSGTVDVTAMTIASQRKMTAKPTVSNQLALVNESNLFIYFIKFI